MIAPVRPDWNGLLTNLSRNGTPARVYYFEHGIAPNIQAGIAERYALWKAIPDSAPDGAIRRTMAVHRFLGHELFRIFPDGARMRVPPRDAGWEEEGAGPIGSWDDFERFIWPDPAAADLSCMEQVEAIAPDNQRAFHVMDVWEVVRQLMGFESLCFALYEQPDLVQAVFDRVGRFVEAIIRTLCDFPHFGAVYIGDDLGFKTSTLIHPDHIRRFIIPWHQRLARLTHDRGKLFLFHSCGDMYALMDDYIDTVHIDAKHSFEDAVLPVTEAKRRYGSRLSLLGGVDVDFLARAEPDAIRRRTREILAVCQAGGGYCLGSGNWVTDYIPLDHYLAMVETARRWTP